jgi:hypothetical protein
MNVRIDNDTQGRIPRRHVLARVTRALAAVDGLGATARVTFSDVNGPKGGADILCALLVSVPGRSAIRVQAAGTTARLAFDESYARALRRIEHVVGRRRDATRRPKKYFVARRLL